MQQTDRIHKNSDLPDLSHLREYSKGFRAVEIVSVVVFALLSFAIIHAIAPTLAAYPTLIVAGLIAGWIAADFMSGLVHWFADTWGSSSWPIVGNTLIRSFREHHVDQMAITKHDFFETNGASCLVAAPVLAATLWLATVAGGGLTMFVVTSTLSFCFWILMTNQAHQWAHRGRARGIVRVLQRSRVLLRTEAHAVHHSSPFEKSYCITSGVLNPVLDRIGFFRGCERVITALTGAEPREEDRRNLGLK